MSMDLSNIYIICLCGLRHKQAFLIISVRDHFFTVYKLQCLPESQDQITFLSLCLERLLKHDTSVYYSVSTEVSFFTIYALDSLNSQESNTDKLHCGKI